MKGWLKYLIGALVIAAVAHFAAIYATPRVLMNTAMTRLSVPVGGRTGVNTFRLGARVTPAARAVVRPSPDLAYSACVYDLSHGPVRLRVTPWRDYWSLSLFAANSDNFYVLDDREARDGIEITLVRAGAAAPRDAANVVESPSVRGIALIRRLAPSPDTYDAVSRIAPNDECAAVNN